MARIPLVSKGPVSETLTVDDMDSNYGYREISATFYTDGTYQTVVDSGMTGTYGLKATPVVNQYEQDVSGATAIDVSVASQLTTPVRIDTAVQSVKATPTAITGATHWELRVRSENER